MYTVFPKFTKITDNCRQLLIEITAKYIMTPKLFDPVKIYLTLLTKEMNIFNNLLSSSSLSYVLCL